MKRKGCHWRTLALGVKTRMHQRGPRAVNSLVVGDDAHVRQFPPTSSPDCFFFFFPHRDQLVFFYAHFRSNHSRHLSQSPPSLTRSSTELSPSCHPCSGSQPNEVVLHLRNCKSVPSRMARPQALSQVQVGKACCRCGRSCAQKQRVSLKDEQNWELKSHSYKQSE